MTDFSPPLAAAPPLPLDYAAMQAAFTPEQLAKFDLQALAASARGEGVEAVCDFGELVFGWRAAAHHKAWIGHILEHPRTAMTAPPSSAKTTWVTQITMAWWIGKHPLSANGIASAGDDAAVNMAAAVANTIELNPRWGDVFGNIVPDKEAGWSSKGYHVKDKNDPDWARKRYGNRNASLTAGGVGSAVWNGLRISDDGLLVLDDIHGLSSKQEQSTNDKTVDWLKFIGENRLETNSKMAIVQTRWNPKDVLAHVKTRPDFKVFEHPAITTDENGAERSYWPKVRPLADLVAIRDRDLAAFELQFQGNDSAVEGTVLKAAWLLPYLFLDIRKEWNRYFGIDFAKRVKQIINKRDDPDHFALAVYVDAGARLVVEEMFDQLLFMGDAEELFFVQAGHFKPKATGVETNGNGNEYYLNLNKRMRVLGVTYHIRPIHTRFDMGERMAEIAPYFQYGQIMVSDKPSAGLDVFRGQWASFPRGHDDTLSAIHQGWKVTSHLLPVDNRDVTQERARAAAAYVSPARQIDMAYGIGR